MTLDDLELGLERYQKYTRYPIPNSIAFADADTRYRYPILGMLNDYRIKCSFSISFVAHSILELAEVRDAEQ